MWDIWVAAFVIDATILVRYVRRVSASKSIAFLSRIYISIRSRLVVCTNKEILVLQKRQKSQQKDQNDRHTSTAASCRRLLSLLWWGVICPLADQLTAFFSTRVVPWSYNRRQGHRTTTLLPNCRITMWQRRLWRLSSFVNGQLLRLLRLGISCSPGQCIGYHSHPVSPTRIRANQWSSTTHERDS